MRLGVVLQQNYGRQLIDLVRSAKARKINRLWRI
jgi:hypothetical protein